MFKSLTYRNKNKLLLVFFIILGFTIYSKSIKKSILQFQECNKLREKVDLASDAPEKANDLKRKLLRMEAALGKNNNINNAQQQLLTVISNYCQTNGLILREFPKTLIESQNDLVIETNLFIVEGNFIKLLQLVYLLEQKERIGKLASVNFQSKMDNRTKKLALTAAIYVQNVKK